MRKIIIDCDPGHDDALAILLALANSDTLAIEGITTVGGNGLLDNVSRNALKVLKVANATNIPVYKGSEGPLIKPLETGDYAHGDSGMDGPVVDISDMCFAKGNAIEFMKDTLLHHDKVTLVAIGPLTNIALLLKMYPEVKSHIEAIAIMGGAYSVGNVTPSAEFNYYVDPHAAYIVYHSGCPIIQAGCEVCEEAAIYHEEANSLPKEGVVAKFVRDLFAYYFLFSKGLGLDHTPIFDAVIMMYLIHPEIFEGKMQYVDIELTGQLTEGMSVTDRRYTYNMKQPNTLVLYHVQREKMIQYLFEAIEKLNKQKR